MCEGARDAKLAEAIRYASALLYDPRLDRWDEPGDRDSWIRLQESMGRKVRPYTEEEMASMDAFFREERQRFIGG